MMVPGIVVAILVVLFLGVKAVRASRLISPEDAQYLLKKGGLLVDVRTREEFSANHIPQARNIPFDQLLRRKAELGRGHLVIYAEHGDESSKAAQLLRGTGLTKVHDLGAMSRWKPAHG